jgi:hypothetical protein
MAKLTILCLLLVAACTAAQEIPLGDLARQDRARQEAAEAANFKLGVPPPVAREGEAVPAHFLIMHGEAGQGEFNISLNGHSIFHNSYVRELPIYISSMLLDGGNRLEISMTSGPAPFDISVEERLAGESNHRVLAHFHVDASSTPAPLTKELRFQAHPLVIPPVQLTDADRDAIGKVVKTFYETLKRKDSKGVLALFAPAIEDARALNPEGADFGEKQMAQMANLVNVDGFAMESFDELGLQMEPHGLIVAVKRRDGTPVFTSTQISLPNGNRSSVSADVIPVKKIQGQWRLTLPFGF